MNQLNPRDFLTHPEVRPFGPFRTMFDLTGSNIRTLSAGRYVVCSYRPADRQVAIIKAIVPYAAARFDVGAKTEAFRYLTPEEANGCFLFQPWVQSASVFQTGADVVAGQMAVPTPDNADRANLSGMSHVSVTPEHDAILEAQTAWRSFVVPAGGTLEVVFQLLPTAAAPGSVLPGRYTIGGVTSSPATETPRRVDFAGVALVGLTMPAQVYDRIARAVEAAPGV